MLQKVQENIATSGFTPYQADLLRSYARAINTLASTDGGLRVTPEQFGGVQAAIDYVFSEGGGEVFLGAQTYTEQVTLYANVHLVGVGRKSIIKAPAATPGNTVNIAGNYCGMSSLVIDCADAAAGAQGIFSSGWSDCYIRNVRVSAPPAHGLWVFNGSDWAIHGLTVDGAGDWAILFDGSSFYRLRAFDLYCLNGSDRGVMCRSIKDSQIHGVWGLDNRATALWFLDCDNCQAFGVIDRNDLVGDSAVIEGASTGCFIYGVDARDCGGHGASISSTSTAGPKSCHIIGVWSDRQGESMAVISDQGSGFQPTDCSIVNVKGKDCGRVTPYEAFGIGNAVLCRIQGSIFSTAGTMTYAVRETGGSPSSNIFEIDGWVSGTSGYFQLGSSTSTIVFPRLEGRVDHKGDADVSWSPNTDGTIVVFDLAALTAARSITLANAWSGYELLVSRPAAGAFNLSVKNAGGTTLKTLAAAKQCRLSFDGSNWVVVSSGDV